MSERTTVSTVLPIAEAVFFFFVLALLRLRRLRNSKEEREQTIILGSSLADQPNAYGKRNQLSPRWVRYGAHASGTPLRRPLVGLCARDVPQYICLLASALRFRPHVFRRLGVRSDVIRTDEPYRIVEHLNLFQFLAAAWLKPKSHILTFYLCE